MTGADMLAAGGRVTIGGTPEGADALAVAALAKAAAGPLVVVMRDATRLHTMAQQLDLLAPEMPCIALPAWDCLPYDRVGPSADIAAGRLAALSALAADPRSLRVVLTTVNALVQLVPPRNEIAAHHLQAAAGEDLPLDQLTDFLVANGYMRVGTVREPGDFAVRGGIVDLYPAGAADPVRLDYFGDEIENIRCFDAETQTTTGHLPAIDLLPVSEVFLSQETIKRFRRGYVALFGAVTSDDPLYDAVSSGGKHAGIEHWLPLFYERLETLLDYVPGAPVVLDAQVDAAREERLAAIADYFEARRSMMGVMGAGLTYNPVPSERLYLSADGWEAMLAPRKVRVLGPHAPPPASGQIDFGGRPGRSFAPERQASTGQVFEALTAHIETERANGRRIVFAAFSDGARERIAALLGDHCIAAAPADSWQAVLTAPVSAPVAVVTFPLDQGFVTNELCVVAEQDVLGDRLVRAARKKRKAENFLTEASALAPGDFVVHVDHGIGRYLGLETIKVSEAPHDCLAIEYHGGDKLFLPVENIELLSRYGSEGQLVQLDKLGGAAWQARKAKVKERIKEIADQLIKVAAERALRTASPIASDMGLYQDFAARFPYEETEDQARSIEDVLSDLGSGKPMDRLVCGDVGFGKTEVALRAAFVAAMMGRQVAVVVPTTLLARQHFRTFLERFAGWPIEVRQLSRMVPAKDAKRVREGLADGSVDVVVGTHALLSKQVTFRDLGLLIVDEEQHFGVQHKERLKQLRADVHVLTLSATPIPRTLQLALSGVRELSLIATPPIDRLAIRTYVTPFDPVVVREALLREKYRGGQSFYVCPRIKDLPDAEEFLRTHVPEVKPVIAHGQMAASALDEIMNAFYDGQYDVLVSTTIVESGLDIPTANTMIVHRADMFGLSQLYQLRGRIGRAKARAYAYLTVDPRKKLTDNAARRLRVLQSLDSLGAGFQVASHDLDIRGAGNLLGEEQSGHVKEVGFELYQHMLEEAVAALRSGDQAVEVNDQWAPQINLGASVLIPETYVSDLDVRLGLYRRLSQVEDEAGLEAFAAELIDRFGALPEEVQHLLEIVRIKVWCRRAGIAKLDAGPKGVIVGFRRDQFANPAGLIDYITRQRGVAKVRPDHRLVFTREFESVTERLRTGLDLARTLAGIAEAEAAAA